MAAAARLRLTAAERSPAAAFDTRACCTHAAIEYVTAPGARWQRAWQPRHRSTKRSCSDAAFPRGSFEHVVYAGGDNLFHLLRRKMPIPMVPGPAAALQLRERSCCDTALPGGSLNLLSNYVLRPNPMPGRRRCCARQFSCFSEGAARYCLGWQICECRPATANQEFC